MCRPDMCSVCVVGRYNLALMQSSIWLSKRSCPLRQPCQRSVAPTILLGSPTETSMRPSLELVDSHSHVSVTVSWFSPARNSSFRHIHRRTQHFPSSRPMCLLPLSKAIRFTAWVNIALAPLLTRNSFTSMDAPSTFVYPCLSFSS
jgi:hypothetical protein